jgi:predicted GNAT family acetyltransferase
VLVWYDGNMITIEGSITGKRLAFSLLNDGKEIGAITGAGFTNYHSEPDLWEDADKLGIDLEMLMEASDKNLLAPNVLVLDTMEINEAYRGKGYGIALIKQAIKSFLHKSMNEFVVLMHPCPIAWPDDNERTEGMKALSNYYAKHFPIKRINNSDYFYFTVDNQTAL